MFGIFFLQVFCDLKFFQSKKLKRKNGCDNLSACAELSSCSCRLLATDLLRFMFMGLKSNCKNNSSVGNTSGPSPEAGRNSEEHPLLQPALPFGHISAGDPCVDAHGGSSLPCHLLRAREKWTVKFLGASEREVKADPGAEGIKSDSRGRQRVLGIQGQFCHQLPKQS